MYLPSHWCRDTFQSEEGSQMSNEILVDNLINDVHCHPISKTKGHPKTK